MQSVLALGEVFSQVFRHVHVDGTVKAGEAVNFNDAFVSTFALLSLASPNRSSAEIPLVPKQKLTSYSEKNGAPVYYLNWIGSKGYKDYKNHILGALAEPIKKSVSFFFHAAEPARILCRFYQNPKQTLKALLDGYPIAFELKNNIEMSRRANLFTLGYALGFYQASETVPVVSRRAPYSGEIFEERSIYALTLDDVVSTSRTIKVKKSSLPKLFGYDNIPLDFFPVENCTVQTAQDTWIRYFTRTILPTFPLSYSSGESSINLKDALFCFMGDWFHGSEKKSGNGGKSLSRSKYSVISLASLGALGARRLTGYDSGSSIFESYGFSSELNLRPHRLRHLSNTLADMSGIPLEIITAWSGRKNSEQTHTYIHTSEDEKADRISAIINSGVADASQIRIITEEQLAQATNLPASSTSTGICTQSLNVNPCNFLNDFMSQCFMCSEACHIAGDSKATVLLEQDCTYQKARLEMVENDPRLRNSLVMQNWYIAHSQNVHSLGMLITLMKDHPQGTVIRYSKRCFEFSLTDLRTMRVSNIKLALPDHEHRLKLLIDKSVIEPKNLENSDLQSLLSSFGLIGSQE
ncbi:hypothetical protein [Pseudomonas amygdali]|nr:hypothetical protein [Pseudomonas amygdali]